MGKEDLPPLPDDFLVKGLAKRFDRKDRKQTPKPIRTDHGWTSVGSGRFSVDVGLTPPTDVPLADADPDFLARGLGADRGTRSNPGEEPASNRHRTERVIEAESDRSQDENFGDSDEDEAVVVKEDINIDPLAVEIVQSIDPDNLGTAESLVAQKAKEVSGGDKQKALKLAMQACTLLWGKDFGKTKSARSRVGSYLEAFFTLDDGDFDKKV